MGRRKKDAGNLGDNAAQIASKSTAKEDATVSNVKNGRATKK